MLLCELDVMEYAVTMEESAEDFDEVDFDDVDERFFLELSLRLSTRA